MRVLVLCEDSSALGGVRTFVGDFIEMMQRVGVEVEVCSRYARDPGRVSISGAARSTVLLPADYLEVVDGLGSESRSEVRDSLLKRLAAHKEAQGREIRELFRGLTDNDVVLVVQVPALLALEDAGVLPTGSRGPAVVAQFHGTHSYAVKQTYFSRLVRGFNQADASVFLTDDDRLAFEADGVRNGHAVPNSVSVPSHVEPVLERPKRAVFIGRLHAEKNIDALIDGWARAQLQGWKLEIFGDGPEASRAAELIRDRGLAPSVEMMGRTDDPTSALSGARINLMTSPQEGMPMVLLEALAAGTPSVCFDAGPGTRELMRSPECGRVIPVGDLDGWARSLQEMAGSSQTLGEMSRACRRQAPNYSKSAVSRRWQSLFETVIHRPKETRMLRFAPVPLQSEVKRLRVTLDVGELDLPEKAFLLQVVFLDPEGLDVTRDAVELPFSSITRTAFRNSPSSEQLGDRSYLTMPFSLTGRVGDLHLSLIPWGTRRWSPTSAIEGACISVGYEADPPSVATFDLVEVDAEGVIL